MNLHPILVHFPIALLTIYALMEMLRLKKLLNWQTWFYVKAILVMMGGLGALAAYFSGSMARSAVRSGDFVVAIPNFRQVVAMHENFAKISITIFGIIASSYLIAWINKELMPLRGGATATTKQSLIWFWLLKFSDIIQKGPVVTILALAGLICITITGGLGGVIVYGPFADPFFGAVYKLLFP